ncbi:MAG: hypothetical protein J4F32_05030 [Dehalococcoidia bacterium]|nr:hypothetical protein [Dehalococcoidia bacterium]
MAATVRLLVIAPTTRELGGLRPCADRACRAAAVGVGHEAAPAFATLLDAERPSAVLSLGFAGGLRPGLSTGALALCDAALGEGAAPIALDPYPAVDALRAAGIAAASSVLLTVDEPLLTPEAKHAAHAASGAAVVDMEGYALACVARERGVPIVALRAVLDAAEHALPPFVADIVADGGRGELRHTLRNLRADPPLILRLPMLAWRSRVAARALRRGVRALIPALAAHAEAR